jgi:Fe-Mn family superoxide dismutase
MSFELPALPYAFDALEPHIDAQTMEIHHGKHHAGYVSKLNAAIEGHDLDGYSIEQLVANLHDLPAEIRTAVRNNGGGHANHSLFWTVLSGDGGGQPKHELGKAIDERFGSFDRFADQFTKAALGQFGSGWAWLTLDVDNRLGVESTPNQDNPLSQGRTPLLGIDVWEHAYYLKYQNRRPDYVEAFFNIIDWNAVTERYVNAVREQLQTASR